MNKHVKKIMKFSFLVGIFLECHSLSAIDLDMSIEVSWPKTKGGILKSDDADFVRAGSGKNASKCQPLSGKIVSQNLLRSIMPDSSELNVRSTKMDGKFGVKVNIPEMFEPCLDLQYSVDPKKKKGSDLFLKVINTYFDYTRQVGDSKWEDMKRIFGVSYCEKKLKLFNITYKKCLDGKECQIKEDDKNLGIISQNGKKVEMIKDCKNYATSTKEAEDDLENFIGELNHDQKYKACLYDLGLLKDIGDKKSGKKFKLNIEEGEMSKARSVSFSYSGKEFDETKEPHIYYLSGIGSSNYYAKSNKNYDNGCYQVENFSNEKDDNKPKKVEDIDVVEWNERLKKNVDCEECSQDSYLDMMEILKGTNVSEMNLLTWEFLEKESDKLREEISKDIYSRLKSLASRIKKEKLKKNGGSSDLVNEYLKYVNELDSKVLGPLLAELKKLMNTHSNNEVEKKHIENRIKEITRQIGKYAEENDYGGKDVLRKLEELGYFSISEDVAAIRAKSGTFAKVNKDDGLNFTDADEEVKSAVEKYKGEEIEDAKMVYSARTGEAKYSDQFYERSSAAAEKQQGLWSTYNQTEYQLYQTMCGGQNAYSQTCRTYHMTKSGRLSGINSQMQQYSTDINRYNANAKFFGNLELEGQRFITAQGGTNAGFGFNASSLIGGNNWGINYNNANNEQFGGNYNLSNRVGFQNNNTGMINGNIGAGVNGSMYQGGQMMVPRFGGSGGNAGYSNIDYSYRGVNGNSMFSNGNPYLGGR